MKRLLVLLSAVLLLAACHNESRDPVIKGYKLEQVSGLSLGAEGVTADMTLDLDVENPSSARYTVESLEAILYRLDETSRFAYVTMDGTATIEPKSEKTVAIPLNVRLLRPLALLTGDMNGLDISQYCADVDLTVRKGGLKKRIQRERVPLAQLGQLLGTTQNPKPDETH